MPQRPLFESYDELTPPSVTSLFEPYDDSGMEMFQEETPSPSIRRTESDREPSISETMYPETKFNYQDETPTMGEQKLQMPRWSFNPGEEAQLNDPGFSLQTLKDQFTWPNAFRMGASTIGDAAGAALSPFTAGLSYPVLSGLGGFVGEMGGQIGEGKGWNDLNWKTGLVEGALNPLIPGPNMPGKGAGLKAAGKYALKSAESGGLQGLIGATPRKMANEGVWDKEGNLNYAGVDETAGQVGVGALTGGVVGGALHGGTTGVRAYNARPKPLGGGLYDGEVPSNARQAGNTSTVWDDVDFTQPVNEQKLLGAADTPDPVVTLNSPDMATIQSLRDRGYVMIPRDPDTGAFRMAHESVASQYNADVNAPFTPEEMSGTNDIDLQANTDNVVPFPQRDPVDQLDGDLLNMGAGERAPAHNQGDPAWEESITDMTHTGPTDVIQGGLHEQTRLGAIGSEPELQQPNLPLNKRVIERGQRKLRDSVPTAPEGELPPSDMTQGELEFPVMPGHAGPGSAQSNDAYINLRDQLGREPTREELANATWGPPEPEDPNRYYGAYTGYPPMQGGDPIEGNPQITAPDLRRTDMEVRAEIDNSTDTNEIYQQHVYWQETADQLRREGGRAEAVGVYQELAQYADERLTQLYQESRNRNPFGRATPPIPMEDFPTPINPMAMDWGTGVDFDSIQAGIPQPTPGHPTLQQLINALSSGQITREQYDIEFNAHQNRLWNAPRDNTRVRGRQPPPDPSISPDSPGFVAVGVREIDGTTDAFEAETLSRMYEDDIAAARYDGNDEQVAILQYLSDYAYDRGQTLRNSGHQIPYTPPQPFGNNFPDDPQARIREDESRGMDEIDAADDYEDVRSLARYWEIMASSTDMDDAAVIQSYNNLASYARARAVDLQTNGTNNYSITPPRSRSLITQGAAPNPNDSLLSRMRHRANIAAASQGKFQEEQLDAEQSQPLPLFEPYDNKQRTLPGMEVPQLNPIMRGGEKIAIPPDFSAGGAKVYQPKLKFGNPKVAEKMQIKVSQELKDDIDRTIASIDPKDLMTSLSHGYATQTLMHEPKGRPGLQVEKDNYHATIWYRSPDGTTIAKALVDMGTYSPEIVSFVSDKSAGGSFGKGVFEIAKEFLKLGAFKPGGGYSPHTRNFIQEVQKYLVVDPALGQNGKHHYLDDDVKTGPIEKNPELESIIAEELASREPLSAIGDEVDELRAAATDQRAEAILVDSPTTVGEVLDRSLAEIRRRRQQMGIEKGEMLGGPPDDNGPGTEIGSIFGAMGGAASRFASNAGWGQGGQTGAHNLGTPPNTPPPTPQDDYSFVQELMQVPRNAVTTLDISFAGRQALGTITRPEFWKAFAAQFKGATQRGFDAMDAVNRSSPVWQRPVGPNGNSAPSIAERMGLELYQQASNSGPGPRQQAVASRWLETGGSLPIVSALYSKTYGKAVRTSNRMYLTMANTLTTKLAESLVASAEDMAMSAINRIRTQGGGTTTIRPGMMKRTVTAAEAIQYNPYVNQEFATELGDFIRTATGHAPLKAHLVPHKNWETNAEAMAGFLNKTMFSSGLFASRVRMTIPGTYMMASPMVRKEYMRSALGVAAFWWGGAYAMKMALEGMGIDAYISMDWNSSDFGKLRIKNSRLDIAGGHQQFLVNYGRMWAGGKSSPSDYAESMGTWRRFGEGYRSETQGDNLQRFASNKMEPVTKFAYDLAFADEKNPFHVGDRLAQLVIPLYIQDLMEIAKEDPRLLPVLGGAALFGGGTQIYDRNESVAKIIPAEHDWLVGGGGGIRALAPWNWGEEKGEYQGPGR